MLLRAPRLARFISVLGTNDNACAYISARLCPDCIERTALLYPVPFLDGDVAEWLRSGLQIRVCRFDSGRHLQQPQERIDGPAANAAQANFVDWTDEGRMCPPGHHLILGRQPAPSRRQGRSR